MSNDKKDGGIYEIRIFNGLLAASGIGGFG